MLYSRQFSPTRILHATMNLDNRYNNIRIAKRMHLRGKTAAQGIA